MKKPFLWVLVATLCAMVMPATAQTWPSKPVRFIVPFGAGATPDIVARMLAERLQARLNQPFVVENKPGASGNLGTDLVAKAEPDGYTIGMSIPGPLAINTLLFSKLPYNPSTDLVMITRVADQPSILAVNAQVPVRSAADLLGLLKREPGKHNFGSIGTGSLSHLAMEAIALKAGTTLVHVPYASSPQAVTALIRGDVQFVCLPAASVVAQEATGKIRLLAVTSAKRSPLLPELPTLKEADIDVEANAWMGLVAPAKTPQAIVDTLQREVAEALKDPQIREKLKANYMEPIGSTPAEFRAFIDSEMKFWTPVIETGHIRIN
ncbi:MAG TPA: tripartite tricarboxylate transporter substrate binding protein [Pseudolabrys sp.]|nr:tripartite tricarboxylate transporter substrate binding protein [Pseudolabrys sp.]